MLYSGKKVLMKKVRFAKTQFQRMKGLMFEDVRRFDYALVFEFPHESKLGSSLHMVFVFFPIDVLFLDEKKKVVDNVTLHPFNPNYTPKAAAKYVIEMPAGKAKGVKIGQEISWKTQSKK